MPSTRRELARTLDASIQVGVARRFEFGESVLEQPIIYRASRYWRTIFSGAVLAGIVGMIPLLTSLMIASFISEFGAREILIWLIMISLSALGMLLAFYPGNWLLTYPLAVEVESSKQIVLIGPWQKRLIIPIADIRDIRNSSLHHRRHGLLKFFIINWFFGDERVALAQAITTIVM